MAVVSCGIECAHVFVLCGGGGGGGGEVEHSRDATAAALPHPTALIVVSHSLSRLFVETPFVSGGLEHHVF